MSLAHQQERPCWGGGRGSLDAHLGRVLEADDIDYDTDPLRIFPVVGGWLHEGVSTIANVVTLPVAPGKAAAFEAATLPAFATLDAEEEGAHCYLLVKQPDESNYHFIELFADKESERSFGANPAWKAMAERQTAASSLTARTVEIERRRGHWGWRSA